MTEKKKRPNVTGKGPALTREMMAIFGEITGDCSKLSDEAAGKLKAALEEKTADFTKVIKMAYLKTVKAGQVAWDCKEMAVEMKAAVDAGDENKVLEIQETLISELDQFLHKTKTFVVRMT